MKSHFVTRSLVFASVCVLAGCTGQPSKPVFNDAEAVKAAPVSPQPAVPVPGVEINADARLEQAPGVQPVPQFPIPQDRDLRIITNKLAGGSVEIYDIEDDSTAQGAPLLPVQGIYNPVGIPSSRNPNVTVYPTDGQSQYPGQLEAPIEPLWPNAVLPAPAGKVKSSLTPAPENWGGNVDGSMSVGRDGKLVSRVVPDGATVFFPYGSSSLNHQDREVLSSVAQTAKYAPVERVSVEGHASRETRAVDPVRAKILNLKESMNRAYAVSQDLIQKGVPAEKIQAVGWGDTKIGSEPEPAQRRVDVYTGAVQ